MHYSFWSCFCNFMQIFTSPLSLETSFLLFPPPPLDIHYSTMSVLQVVGSRFVSWREMALFPSDLSDLSITGIPVSFSIFLLLFFDFDSTSKKFSLSRKVAVRHYFASKKELVSV